MQARQTPASAGRQALDARLAAPKKRRMRRPSRAVLVYAPSLIAGAVVIGCALYMTTLTTVPHVQAVGSLQDGTLSHDLDYYERDIERLFAGSLANRSKLLIDTSAMSERIQRAYPELGQVGVVLPLAGRRPIVHIDPSPPALILASPMGAYVIDTEGRVIAEASQLESSARGNLIRVRDQSGLPLRRGTNALPRQSVTFIQEVTRQLTAKELTVESMELPRAAYQLDVRLKGTGYFIKFNTRGQGRVQSGTYLALREYLRERNLTPGRYVDVRVVGRAFYR